MHALLNESAIVNCLNTESFSSICLKIKTETLFSVLLYIFTDFRIPHMSSWLA